MAGINAFSPAQPIGIASLLTGSIESAQQVTLPKILSDSGLQLTSAPQQASASDTQQKAQLQNTLGSLANVFANYFVSPPASQPIQVAQSKPAATKSAPAQSEQLSQRLQHGLSSGQAAARKANGAGFSKFEKTLTPAQKAAQDKWKRLKAQGAPASEWQAAQEAYKATFTPEQKALHDQSMALSKQFTNSLSENQSNLFKQVIQSRESEWVNANKAASLF